MKRVVVVLILAFASSVAYAQDPLPSWNDMKDDWKVIWPAD